MNAPNKQHTGNIHRDQLLIRFRKDDRRRRWFAEWHRANCNAHRAKVNARRQRRKQRAAINFENRTLRAARRDANRMGF